MIIVSRIIHGKADRKINVKNKFKYQRRLLSRHAIVMFRGTPCIYQTFNHKHRKWEKIKNVVVNNTYSLHRERAIAAARTRTELEPRTGLEAI